MMDKIKVGDKFTVRKGAFFARIGDDERLTRIGIVDGFSSLGFECVYTRKHIDGEATSDRYEIIANTPSNAARIHFFSSDCTKVAPAIDYNQRLIDYMEAKAAAIAVQTGGKVRDFFLPEDAEDIRGWCAEKAKVRWVRITENFYVGQTVSICPFCGGRSGCIGCGYGKRHGICDSDYSTWNKTVDFMPRVANKTSIMRAWFTPYQQVVMKAALEGE